MSLEGRINVDCLFHDRAGTARLKVLSLRSNDRYTTGVAIIVTGTAGTAGADITLTGYRNAAGSLVSVSSPLRLAFAWSGTERRMLDDIGDQAWRLLSSNNQVSVTQLPDLEPVPLLSPGDGTGTYTIIVWGLE